jgi:hypothetical protein
LDIATEENINSTPRELTEEDCKNIIKYFINIQSDLIKDFFETKGIVKSGTKKDFYKRLIESLDTGKISYYEILTYLESIELFGKQHIILYNGPEKVTEFRNEKFVMKNLKNNDFCKYLNADLPVIFPLDLSLASIKYFPGLKLEIYAIEAQNHFERLEEQDDFIKRDGRDIELRAHLRKSKRGITFFRWDLELNQANLQILQLPQGYSYEEYEKKFKSLIKPFLNLNSFKKIDLKPLIKKLHKLEETDKPETRSHGLGYKTVGGRSIIANSSNSDDSVLGETVVDTALTNIRKKGIGYTGNFYWLPLKKNSLENEVRTLILADQNRINFSSPTNEGDIEYVLSRIRDLVK